MRQKPIRWEYTVMGIHGVFEPWIGFWCLLLLTISLIIYQVLVWNVWGIHDRLPIDVAICTGMATGLFLFLMYKNTGTFDITEDEDEEDMNKEAIKV